MEIGGDKVNCTQIALMPPIIPTGPNADSGEVVVKVETCGLRHSDIHAAHGDWPFKPKLPLIPGHEVIGIVESLGKPQEWAEYFTDLKLFWSRLTLN
jgi:threonine dehydrogenase-like Zn-dependent dehydrogenase